MRVQEFKGIRTDAAPAALEPQEFQVDEGTTRYETDDVGRRRGHRRLNIDQFNGPVTAQLGFDMPGPQFGYLVVAGPEIWGVRQIGVL